jgi:hypothetical protein
MYILRDITETLERFAKFPVVGVFGPRQSGKTTLVKQVFGNHRYLNFEDPAIRSFAAESPQNFLREYENEYGIILDEFQYVPEILSYIQIEADLKDRPGYFVLTGSQNFLMNEAITQSLAGRIGILTLLPLSIHELESAGLLTENVHEAIVQGGYPRLFAKNMSPEELYPSYIHSYVERDIRLLVNVENLSTFQRFMQLCAGRVGQLTNFSDLAVSCGIDLKTVKSWLSILEASYIIFLLNPYHGNFNKRITKSSKLYFYDTGLACSLLNMRSSQELALSVFKGHLFENYIIADLFKQYYNRGTKAPLYFWRDMNGRIEVDCLVDRGVKLIPIEIKAGEAPLSDYFEGIARWNELVQADQKDSYVIYGGQHVQHRSVGTLVGWRSAGTLIEELEK